MEKDIEQIISEQSNQKECKFSSMSEVKKFEPWVKRALEVCAV